MSTPRSQIVDPQVTPWYHCISRCVRRAYLCGDGFAHRTQWIEDRLKELAAYIDLNPVAAGIAPTPESSEHTSFRARLHDCRAEGLMDTVRDGLSTERREPAQESAGWLLSVEDRGPVSGGRAGLMPGLTFSCYAG
jgi:hypothetical protein